MKKFTIQIVSVFVVAIFSMQGLISTTHAQIISDQQVQEQKREVLLRLVDTMQEQVKLLQMLYIQKLEKRVEMLQSQVRVQP